MATNVLSGETRVSNIMNSILTTMRWQAEFNLDSVFSTRSHMENLTRLIGMAISHASGPPLVAQHHHLDSEIVGANNPNIGAR